MTAIARLTVCAILTSPAWASILWLYTIANAAGLGDR